MSVDRFIEPQKEYYETALSEIKRGGKDTHWMWFIFPQVKGLGTSGISQYYGIESLEEAKEFLLHPILGSHLREITDALLTRSEKAEEIFGYPDYLKLKSSMTLFELAGLELKEYENYHGFTLVLNQFFKGEHCPKTKVILDGKYTLGYRILHPEQ